MVFFTCFVQGSTIKFFVKGKCQRYFPWPTFKLLSSKSNEMSMILENILTISSTVFHITLKVGDEEGRLFKDIQVSMCMCCYSVWATYHLSKMTVSDNIMTVLESIIGINMASDWPIFVILASNWSTDMRALQATWATTPPWPMWWSLTESLSGVNYKRQTLFYIAFLPF